MHKHFLDKFGENSIITYAQYVQEALFSEEIGYYRCEKKRVGKELGTDFYTATTIGPVFWRLVLDAAKKIAEETADIFVEIGAEPESYDYQKNLEFPFKNGVKIHLGEDIKIPNNSVVFSNELLDAQPFHKLVYKEGEWAEFGVRICKDRLEEDVLEDVTDEMRPYLDCFPAQVSEGYVIDFPLGAIELLRKITEEDWEGSLMFFDYGKSWLELCEQTPGGTARAYFNHCQNNDILRYPGKQDITHHVCWDFLIDVLKSNGFKDVRVIRQELFFIEHAHQEIGRIIEHKAGEFSEDRQALQALLHPGHMGAKFQILLAIK